jgi:hypothetical protein
MPNLRDDHLHPVGHLHPVYQFMSDFEIRILELNFFYSKSSMQHKSKIK